MHFYRLEGTQPLVRIMLLHLDILERTETMETLEIHSMLRIKILSPKKAKRPKEDLITGCGIY